ncbi:putative transcription factor C2H2 family [Helianthus annuus]|nr:putative transcription factor C2H2 family [Helianthus annuus]
MFRVTMSDAGERTCPLCAEEMDLTDQQLKPCKCGYDICVWCWHHIMDMSEKDNTEGRCPACRTPYNKEKIVGTASKCERLVTGMNMEKKQKSQKGKTKTAEARKELTSVRVIQRNLVYIVGLPLNLADEDLLQQKEYFGQYGKVLKVSISRTAAGEIQQFPNSTCSVYITYSKEEEAVRSIQSAHGFILEGRPLRACFGTTKYCHAWLRNTPCTNADCLYLHEYGPQEDSFTKDEIVSAYTRNKVQQITGATNDMQQRSGNFLPPPVDDYSKPISKNTINNPANTLKVSPPNSSCGRSEALPAAASWGTRASISQPIVANGASTTLPKKHCEENHNLQEKGNLGNPTSIKKTDDRTTLCKTPVTTGLSSSSTATIQLSTTSLDSKNTSLETTNKNQTPQGSHLVSDLQKKVSQVAISEAKEQNPPHIMDPASLDQNLERAPQHPVNVSNGVFEDHTTTNLGLGENTIISNILSMDFDPWDESLTSPQNLAKFLGESNKQVLSSRKPQNSNQSRFSFARQDDCTDQGLNYTPSLSDFGRGVEYNNNSVYYDNKFSNSNGFSSFSFEKSNHFAAGYPETKISVSRTQVSAPPGFSGPSRAPPPGFTLNNISASHNYDTFKKSHEAAAAATVSITDLDFMDPAILAVGGRVPTRSNFPTHMNNSFENDTRLQFLMQSSFSHQNPRFTDNYQQTSFQQQMSSLNVKGHWNGGNDRMGFNRYYSGHEEAKFQLSTSGDLYNRTFGI